jgi:predicted DsbA family dithiol-disulfide isomerase
MNLSVDVISEVICPWVFIGKRRLERANLGLGAARRSRAMAAISTQPADSQRRRISLLSH